MVCERKKRCLMTFEGLRESESENSRCRWNNFTGKSCSCCVYTWNYNNKQVRKQECPRWWFNGLLDSSFRRYCLLLSLPMRNFHLSPWLSTLFSRGLVEGMIKLNWMRKTGQWSSEILCFHPWQFYREERKRERKRKGRRMWKLVFIILYCCLLVIVIHEGPTQ